MTDALEQLAARADADPALGAESENDGDELATQGAAPAEPVETLEQGNTRMVCVILAMLREATATPLVFDPPLQTLARRLPDAKLPALAAPWGRVFSHYGVDLRQAIDHPIAEALALTGPALFAIVRELLDELRARRAKAAPAEPAPAPAAADAPQA